jgi:hypothetical protein
MTQATKTNNQILEQLETTLKDFKKWMKQMSKTQPNPNPMGGPEVTIDHKNLQPKQEINDAIDRIGKDLTQPGMKYAGSMTIFQYVSSTDVHMGGGELHAITNFTQKIPLSLHAIRATLDNARVAIINHYTPKGEKPGSGILK